MKLMSKRAVAKWLKETAAEMHKADEAGCASLFLDPRNRNLSLSVGWMGGYGDSAVGDDYRSKKQPDYAVNAAIVEYNPCDCAELEYMSMPMADDESGEVWNTAVTLAKTTDWMKLADYYLKEYKAMAEAIERKELEGMGEAA